MLLLKISGVPIGMCLRASPAKADTEFCNTRGMPAVTGMLASAKPDVDVGA